MSGKTLVYPLSGNQAQAVDPADSVWLSASAGTGKTQVLSARVLRLLLKPDVDPAQILSLTFTKAGAAEMATRVNEVLASWVRMDSTALASDLKAIGEGVDEATLSRARTLFASVLDSPGGGLRIDTIHAFSQWLLAAFPAEAGLTPGTRPMEDRDRDLLAHEVLAAMLVDWEECREDALIGALEMLSIRLGPDGVRAWLMRCADAREAWFGPGSWQEPLEDNVRRMLGLAADTGPASLAALCGDNVFDVGGLRRCLATLELWKAKTGQEGAEAIRLWLSLDPHERAKNVEGFFGTILNKDGVDKKVIANRDADYSEYMEGVRQSVLAFREHKTLLELVDFLTPALLVGRRFALRWEEAKAREGFIDFDDQIRQAAALLSKSDLSEWIRYKLDRRFDHILIDEAQDTNEAQWSIITALTGDFFTGMGQRENKLRTIFVVGDYKQAIFGFQGTSPKNFSSNRDRFARLMGEARANASELREPTNVRELLNIGLGRSYRTAQPVLDFVDRAIQAIGHEQFGLSEQPEPHRGDARPGEVVLWKPVDAQQGDAAGDDDPGEGPETWVSEPERRMADRIAAQIRLWLKDGYPLVKGHPKNPARNAGPGDIMVLVRKRRELAGLIVARLYAAGVPVAGVDRLRLGAPLAVKDLMAGLRFAVQPLDDLSLANWLVSPLGGWSQDNLLEHGHRPKGTKLWDHLRSSEDPLVAETCERLRDLLRLADYELPQALLHWMLTGPWQGRRRLIARLGRDANDPIDELLNAAANYASAHTASLQGFIQWFDAGEGELKRDAGASEGLVRVMTVHGSKGLQAPLVILADATGNPDTSLVRSLSLKEGDRAIPLPPLRRAEEVGPIAAAKQLAASNEREEHWRLLYVAMTRAEEALFVGGALGKREDVPAPDSWYARLEPLCLGDAEPDPVWGTRKTCGKRPDPVSTDRTDITAAHAELLGWAVTPIGPEPRPPRPLAPSSAGGEQDADPPLPPEIARDAARRGVLIHSLLERLPDVAAENREQAARAWLARQARELADPVREEMLQSALTVLATPEFADIFSPAALAEVPLAAIVEGQVIAGTADRLLVTDESVTVIDFKTARRPPAGIDDVPRSTLQQLGAYAAALAEIYPGKAVNVAVLYTQTPLLVPIPADLLAQYKPRLAPAQESFSASLLE
ncbi:double-strand break repair helicase AddA [Allopontixanthobacter sediminis]|uniref:DNA 3'-5' helicase n=1 Tax=Allopontixanthobacter sediminis TaxID=1689985 RepID=A0A845AW93_9SPHN|nr:double-strand break repair helicase AddA [Allopontixanthobacter sediminis]MXP43813.1 double-strand break repair helicase AddA [Allopontixanthobacter sediminis]